VRIAFREQERIQTQLFQMIGKHSGHTWQEIEEHFTRDRFMHAVDAKKYNFIDHILGDTSNLVIGMLNGEVELASTPPLIEGAVNK
jgi:ATP-dependent Clp protease protease subunit